jgi:hypothetical protein
MFAAALRADPEAGNLRFPVSLREGAIEERIAPSPQVMLAARFARILKPGT